MHSRLLALAVLPVLFAAQGRPALALVCVGAWVLTLVLQRSVPGT